MGSFCRFPVGGAGLVVGAFTVLVTMGRVPARTEEKPLNKTALDLYMMGAHKYKQNTQ